MSHDWSRLIGNWFLHAGFILAWASVIAHSRVPWYRTSMGRHLMLYMGVIAVIFGLGEVRLWIGDTPLFSAIRALTYCALIVAMAQRLYLQIQAQRIERANTPPKGIPAAPE